jgi:hypothetical protein
MPAGMSHVFVLPQRLPPLFRLPQLPGDLVASFQLQGMGLFELSEQLPGLLGVVALALKPGKQHHLRPDSPLPLHDVAVGQLKMPGGKISIDGRYHGGKKNIACEALFQPNDSKRAEGRRIVRAQGFFKPRVGSPETSA